MSSSASARFWDRAAEKYARDPIADPKAYTHTLGRMKSYLSAGDHVLEFGAGTSSTAIELAPHVAHYRATDISPEMVRIGQAKAGDIANLEIEVARAEAETGRTYDAVLALNLIHLLPDVDGALAGMADSLPKGGLLMTKTGCLGDASVFKRTMFRLFIGGLRLFGKAPGKVHFLTGADLSRRLERAGFEIIETHHAEGDVPRSFIVARKL